MSAIYMMEICRKYTRCFDVMLGVDEDINGLSGGGCHVPNERTSCVPPLAHLVRHSTGRYAHQLSLGRLKSCSHRGRYPVMA